MAPSQTGSDRGITRRSALAAIAGSSAGLLAGCTETQGSEGDGGDGAGSDDGAAGADLSGEVTVTGSSTVFPISDRMAEDFMEQHPEVNVTVDRTGSGGGFENHFCPGNSDVNGSSRPIRDEEVSHCEENGVEPVEMHVAGDALTVAVNDDADWVDCLTFEELSRIWREDGVDNWSEVREGFPDEPIELFGPASTSGTYDWFLENVVNYDGADRNHTSEHEPTEEDNLIVQGIQDNPGGIGYFGYAYYSENSDQVKALSVRESESDECGAPSLEAASDGTYPMARPLFIYPAADAVQRPEVEAFLEFYLEEVGTDVVTDIGYVPSNDEMVQDNLDTLSEYADS